MPKARLLPVLVTGLRSATLLKESVWNGCFPVNSANFLRTSYSQRLFLGLENPHKVWFFFIRWKKIQETYFRSSHLEVFYKKVVLKHFAKFTGNVLCRSFFFITLQDFFLSFLPSVWFIKQKKTVFINVNKSFVFIFCYLLKNDKKVFWVTIEIK